MATASPIKTEPNDGDQCVVLREISWEGYLAVLRARGERRFPKMVYLDGDLYLVSPASRHEHLAERLGYLVMVIAEELDIPFGPAGGTTFRRKKRKGGVEGDKTFYFRNEERVRGKARLQLRTE